MARFEPVIPDAERHVYDDWHIAPAVRAGPLLVCSGVLGIREDGSIPDDPPTQFELAFENLRRLLDTSGAAFADVIELVTFHIGLDHVIAFSEVKDRYIATPYPAWTAVGVAEVGGSTLPGLLVEIKATAYLG